MIYFILETIKLDKPDHLEVYGDVEVHRCYGVMIHFSVVVIQKNPDKVIIDRSSPTPIQSGFLNYQFHLRLILSKLTLERRFAIHI